MKWFIWFVILGLASGDSDNGFLSKASNIIASEFLVGMKDAPNLGVFLGSEYSQEADIIENDIQYQLAEVLREVVQSTLRKLFKNVEEEKLRIQYLINKLQAEVQKLMHSRPSGTGYPVQDALPNSLTANTTDSSTPLTLTSLQDLDLTNILLKVKEKILKKLDISQLINYLQTIFDKDDSLMKLVIQVLSTHTLMEMNDLVSWFLLPETEKHTVGKRWLPISRAACLLREFVSNGWTSSELKNWITDNITPEWKSELHETLDVGLPGLKIMLSRLCSGAAAPSSPSLLRLWENIRNFFKNLGLEIQDKFFRFAEWVRTTVKGGIEKVKDKVEKLKMLAKQIIQNSKSMSQEVAQEALEYFQPYKNDLGPLWEELRDATTRVIVGF